MRLMGRLRMVRTMRMRLRLVWEKGNVETQIGQE